MRTTLVSAAALLGLTAFASGAQAQPWSGYYRPYPPPFYAPRPFWPPPPFYRPRVFYPPPVYAPPPPAVYAPPSYALPYSAPGPVYVAPHVAYRGRVVHRRPRRAQPVATTPSVPTLRPAAPTLPPPMPAAPPNNAYPPERSESP